LTGYHFDWLFCEKNHILNYASLTKTAKKIMYNHGYQVIEPFLCQVVAARPQDGTKLAAGNAGT
jgi:dihydroneopterin aldolase